MGRPFGDGKLFHRIGAAGHEKFFNSGISFQIVELGRTRDCERCRQQRRFDFECNETFLTRRAAAFL